MTGRTHKTPTGSYRQFDDLHVLLIVAQLGSVEAAARHFETTAMSVRHRLARLYRERGIQAKGRNMTAAHLVWTLRDELEALRASLD